MDDLTNIAPTVIAVDWSGAKGAAQRKGIWVTVVREGEIVSSRGRWTRDEAVEFVASQPAPFVAGFDFSFSVPEWFAHEHGCTTIDDVWALAERDGERWLRAVAPFWRYRCNVVPEQRFRGCEERLRRCGFAPKSVFQLVGNGQVGPGSVRGMPLLARLHATGVAIWPFDAAGPRTALEMYPSALSSRKGTHEEDATRAALVMWQHRDELMALPCPHDPVTRIEGDIWTPTPVFGDTGRPERSPGVAKN